MKGKCQTTEALVSSNETVRLCDQMQKTKSPSGRRHQRQDHHRADRYISFGEPVRANMQAMGIDQEVVWARESQLVMNDARSIHRSTLPLPCAQAEAAVGQPLKTHCHTTLPLPWEAGGFSLKPFD